jgi:hypothetical protein
MVRSLLVALHADGGAAEPADHLQYCARPKSPIQGRGRGLTPWRERVVSECVCEGGRRHMRGGDDGVAVPGRTSVVVLINGGRWAAGNGQ